MLITLFQRVTIATVAVLLIACAGAPKPPNCNDSMHANRVNPEWIGEVADYSIPFDNEQEIKQQKIDTIKTLKKRSSPNKTQKAAEKLVPTPDKTNNSMTMPPAPKKPEAKATQTKARPAWPPATQKKAAMNIPSDAEFKPSSGSSTPKPSANPTALPSYLIPAKGPDESSKQTTYAPPPEELFVDGIDTPTVTINSKVSTAAYEAPVKVTARQVPAASEQTAHKPVKKKAPLFVLHVGSFQSKTNAMQRITTLKKLGYPVYLRSTDIKGVTYHRVFVGPNLSKSDAERFKKQLSVKMTVKRYNSKHKIAQ